ncbi:MAG: hypothetical protein HZC05_02460 [Candidatus Magasanikbacteria bacterium]|nr:hypothetical protein [Candidatus Magasanikbacteria bacterium]
MDLGEAVKKTLAFFELFKHPLTSFELHKLLYCEKKIDLSEIVLQVKQAGIQEANGFFFLSSGSSDLHLERQDRAISNDRKFVLARRAARLISWVPFVRLVAVCNTLSFEAADKGSDIDFFIITRSCRIWLARFLVSAILSIFNLRRRGYDVTDKICLSFFISDDDLDLRKIALPIDAQGNPDIYLVYWISNLIPLTNRGKTLEKFWQANDWAFAYLADFDWQEKIKNLREINIWRGLNWTQDCLERNLGNYFGDCLEKFLKKIQLFKILRHQQSRYFEQGTAVVVNDKMLKFHEEDRREFFRNKWREICVGLNI